MVKLAFFVVIAPGNVVSSSGIGADELVVAMCVDAADCFALKSASMSLDGVVKLAFYVVKATGNVVSSFGIRTDDLVFAMCVVATVCFEQKSAAKSLEGVID